jgi:ubiquinone biosynthesis protein Coq4
MTHQREFYRALEYRKVPKVQNLPELAMCPPLALGEIHVKWKFHSTFQQKLRAEFRISDPHGTSENFLE